jgi:hypothetical protein
MLVGCVVLVFEVYSNPQQSVTLQGDDLLDRGEILPGFSVPVGQIFAELDATQR